MAYVPIYDNAVTRVITVKVFTYRDNPLEEFSNTFAVEGSVPNGDAAWNTLINKVVGAEQSVFDSGVKWVRTYGYGSSDPHAAHLFANEYPSGSQPVGTFVPSGTAKKGAGDQAALVQWGTDVKSHKGKPVFLRKYLHDPWLDTTDLDKLDAGYLSALNTFGQAFVPGGTVAVLRSPYLLSTAGSSYRSALNHQTSPWVTTRTLKRRGKRPLAHP